MPFFTGICGGWEWVKWAWRGARWRPALLCHSTALEDTPVHLSRDCDLGPLRPLSPVTP